ncbi:MAG TPA: putative inorganic carbon transporter subunit DabA, partial [Isosphaeraceae bacterium]|nr:putative inorganic carbon transporter subunit DabA [Isosphaeraceae bacterium]
MQTSAIDSEAFPETDALDPRLRRLRDVIEHVAHMLPAQGPITTFIHHNTLHAFEDLPFSDAVKKGAFVFGCQPYLREDRYRQELARGRIRFDELKEALEGDLGDRATEKVPCFGTLLDLRLAMLKNPLLSGPTDELVWYVAEANALRRVRQEVSAADRARLIAETRRWVIRDLRVFSEATRGGSSPEGKGRRIPESLSELLDRFDESRMEYWSDEAWEGFTLAALWRICCDGVRDLPTFATPPPLAVRHRDVLLEATGLDTDLLVNDRFIPFCAAFLDQGYANWELPRRDEGFFRAFCALYR